MTKQSSAGLIYRQGGNPPHMPGLYLDGRLIVIWPVGVKATEDRVMNIWSLWEASDSAVFGYKRVLSELREGGLL